MSLPFGIHYGVLADDLLNAFPGLLKQAVHPALMDSLGNIIKPEVSYKMVNYTEFIPILIAGIKEQQTRIDSLVSVIGSAPKAGNPSNGLNNQNEELKVSLSNSSDAILDQNQPHPFSDKTIIRYYIPESEVNTSLVFYNSTGVRMKEVQLSQKGEGEVEVETGNITDGIYSYSLIVDGKNVDTKRMMKMK